VTFAHHTATIFFQPSPDFSGLWWGIAAAMLVLLIVLLAEKN